MDIPQELKVGLKRYVEDHIETGGFLRAVLENDLTKATGKADEENIHLLREIVNYIFNELPMSCWGSKEKVAKWLNGNQYWENSTLAKHLLSCGLNPEKLP